MASSRDIFLGRSSSCHPLKFLARALGLGERCRSAHLFGSESLQTRTRAPSLQALLLWVNVRAEHVADSNPVDDLSCLWVICTAAGSCQRRWRTTGRIGVKRSGLVEKKRMGEGQGLLLKYSLMTISSAISRGSSRLAGKGEGSSLRRKGGSLYQRCDQSGWGTRSAPHLRSIR